MQLIFLFLISTSIHSSHSIPHPIHPPTDACTPASLDGIYTTFTKATDCLNSFPFDKDIAVSVLNTLRLTLQLYVFKDIQKNYTDGPINVNTDIIKNLNAIGLKKYIRDREFHDDVNSAFYLL